MTLTVVELLPQRALPFDASPRVVVAHALGITDLLHVVDRDLQPVTEATRAGLTSGAAPGPLPVGGDEDDGHLGDGGPGLDECLDADVIGHPLLQISQILSPISAGSARRATAAKRVEQPQRNTLLNSAEVRRTALHTYIR